MLRGLILVDRLLENQIISDAFPLLVVGAGAGGATAAIAAARQGVGTTLIDRHRAPFMTIASARTRRIDPTQYDWPLGHWREAKFPWQSGHVSMPLDFQPNFGDVLASLWTKSLLDNIAALGGRLRVYFDERIRDNGIRRQWAQYLLPLEVQFTSSNTLNHFGAIIWAAAGFGPENCFVINTNGSPCYEGIPFWNADVLTDLRSFVPNPNVLISGGGDGALQDYLRIVTGYGLARDFYELCNIPDEITRSIQSAEDRAHRGLSWANNDNRVRTKHELPYYVELQTLHERAIEVALSTQDVTDAMQAMLPDPPPVTVIHRGSILTPYYGLNRFLAVLVATFISRKFGRESLCPNTIIADIRSASNPPHNCLRLDPSGMRPVAAGRYSMDGVLLDPECLGKEHRVALESGGQRREQVFNVIVVRHGPGNLPQVPFQAPVPTSLPRRPRHLWPYHLPR